MNNSPINSTINSTTVVELADASSLKVTLDTHLSQNRRENRFQSISDLFQSNLHSV